MCGICGVFDAGAERFAADALDPMLKALVHRGPDDEGRFSLAGQVALGMRRLSIIDVETGQQPFQSEDGRFVLVCNGEIYNHNQLRDELVARGHRFRSQSDAEVVVHLFEEYGRACVSRLHGMFAFAVWDRHERVLTLARDRLGVKPLYYTLSGQCLVFGSEIKAVMAHPAVDASIDLAGLSDFLTLRYVPAPRTMFKGVMSLPPGHLLTMSSAGPSVEKYWDVRFHSTSESDDLSEDWAAERLEELIDDAVRTRLMSDVPFGAFLSGGVDSSSVVATMNRHLSSPVNTFSVGFDGSDAQFSELPYARKVAKHYGTNHHEVIVGPQYFTDNIERIVWHLDQPIGDYAEFAYDAVAHLASSNVKMVLTGEGGDELFAGYGRHVGERLSPWFRFLPAQVKRLLIGQSGSLTRYRRHRTAIVALSQPTEAQRMANWIPLVNPLQKETLLTEDVRHSVRNHSTEDVVGSHLERTTAIDPVQRLLYLDTKLWLPDYLLSRGDKLSMAWSLEARVPLLDHRLVEFAAALPVGLKLKGRTRKHLLRKYAAPILPEQVLTRTKKGFSNPFPQWLRNELRPLARDILAPDALRRRGLFEPEYVARLLDEHDTAAADNSTAIYGLINVELWHRAFID